MHKIYCLIVIFSFIISSCNTGANTTPKEPTSKDSIDKAAIYICPMDCEKGKTYDKPGTCPICEMDLKQK